MVIRGPAGIQISNTGVVVICVTALVLFVYTFRDSLSQQATLLNSSVDDSYKISEILSAAIYLTEDAGNKVKQIRESDHLDEKSKGQTKEGANDPLTQGDLESHRIIVKGFYKAFPNMHLVSEEHEEESLAGVVPPNLHHPDVTAVLKDDPTVSAKDITVWIDPLDATQEYTENLIEYVTVMACIAVKGVPVAGVIRKPFTDETYWAWVDHGTSANLKELHGSKPGSDTVKVIVSRSHTGTVKDVAEKAFKNVNVTPAGGAGFKTIEVIKGTQDVYTHTTLIKKWDICAGDAILRAIGGKQTDLLGKSINYSYFLDSKNEHGLLVSMHDHERYRVALSSTLNH